MGRWLVFQAPVEFQEPRVTLVENVPIGAAPKDYMRQLASILDDTEDFPITFVEVLNQPVAYTKLLEVFDYTGRRVQIERVKLL